MLVYQPTLLVYVEPTRLQHQSLRLILVRSEFQPMDAVVPDVVEVPTGTAIGCFVGIVLAEAAGGILAELRTVDSHVAVR
jgi:hypothetical protein